MSATNLREGETFLVDLGDGAKTARVLCVMPVGDNDMISFSIPEEPCIRPCKGTCDRPCRKYMGFFHEPEGEPGRLVQKPGTKIRELGIAK